MEIEEDNFNIGNVFDLKSGNCNLYVNKKKMKEHGEVGGKRKEINLKTFLPWNA